MGSHFFLLQKKKRLIALNPAGLQEHYLGHGVWQQFCPVQITDGQQDPKSSWKHLPLSVETGWTVSNSQFVTLSFTLYQWHDNKRVCMFNWVSVETDQVEREC